MVENDWLPDAGKLVEQFTGQRPQKTILHIAANGRRQTPAVETADGLQHYIQRNLLGQYNIETHNATFPGKGTAEHAASVLELTGYDGFDVTDLLASKRGIDPQVNPEALADLDKEVVSPEELEALRKVKAERSK